MNHTYSEEKPEVISPKYSSAITLFAKLFSYIFHPLFIPLYVYYYLIFIHQGYFSGYNEKTKLGILMQVTVNMVFFPALSVLLLKQVGFIGSIFLRTQKDRIIPYIAAGIFFFWMYLVFRAKSILRFIMPYIAFGVFLSSSVGLIANIYYKISMHAMGCGGMIGLLLVVLKTNPMPPFTSPLMIAIFISGVVCTSRLIVSNHTQKEIYMGLFWGFVCQFVAAIFII